MNISLHIAAETMDVTCEDDIQVLVDEVRYGKER